MNTQQHTNVGKGIEPPASVLVTGGTGFVGSYVIRDLVTAGYQVKAIRRKPELPAYIDPAIFSKVKWVTCDVLDPLGLEEAMENIDAVIHAAAKVSFLEKERTEMFKINTAGTANIVNAAIQKNIKRLIHVSSVAALGRRENGAIVNETHKWENSKLNTPYSISKYQGEIEVWRGIAEGLNAVIVNPSTIIGYGDWNNSSCALFKSVWDGFPWYTNGINGFVDVENVSDAIVQLLKSDIHSERFILNGENWSYRKLLNAIADGFGIKRPGKEATPVLAAIAWRLEKLKSLITGKKQLLTRETARVAQTDTKFDNSKISGALPGFRFNSLEQTVNHACDQYAGRS